MMVSWFGFWFVGQRICCIGYIKYRKICTSNVYAWRLSFCVLNCTRIRIILIIKTLYKTACSYSTTTSTWESN